MPRKKKGEKKKKEPPDIDWASDQNFNAFEPIVYVEMDRQCFVFKDQLDRFEALMRSKFPQTIFHVVVNSKLLLGEAGSPRNGSFEIWFAQNARCKEELMWTAVAKGPPRRLKFSTNEYEDLWPLMKKILARYYKVEEPKSTEDLDDEDE